MTVIPALAMVAACSPQPSGVPGGPACSSEGAAAARLGGTARAGVSDEGFHEDMDLSLGAIVRPGALRCAPEIRRSEF